MLIDQNQTSGQYIPPKVRGSARSEPNFRVICTSQNARFWSVRGKLPGNMYLLKCGVLLGQNQTSGLRGTRSEPDARYSTVRTEISGNIYPSKISGKMYLLKCAFYLRGLPPRDYINYPEALIRRCFACYPKGYVGAALRLLSRKDRARVLRLLSERIDTQGLHLFPQESGVLHLLPERFNTQDLRLVSGRVGTRASYLLTETIGTQKIALFGPLPDRWTGPHAVLIYLGSGLPCTHCFLKSEYFSVRTKIPASTFPLKL